MSDRLERMDAEIRATCIVFTFSFLVAVISSVLLGSLFWAWLGPFGVLLGFVPGLAVSKFGYDAIEREYHPRREPLQSIDIEQIRERRYQAMRLKTLAANVGQVGIVVDSSSWTGR